MMINLKNTCIKNEKGEIKDLYLQEAINQGINWANGASPLDFRPYKRLICIESSNVLTEGCIMPDDCIRLTLADLKPKPSGLDLAEQAMKDDYDKGMKDAMKKIAILTGFKFGVDVGYEELPSKVDAVISGLTSTIEMLSPDEPKPKPKRVNVSYEKVNQNKEGGLYWQCARDFAEGGIIYMDVLGVSEPADNDELLFKYKTRNLFRKVETEITWQDELTSFISKEKFDGGYVNDFIIGSGEFSSVKLDIDFRERRFIEMCRVVIAAVDDK